VCAPAAEALCTFAARRRPNALFAGRRERHEVTNSSANDHGAKTIEDLQESGQLKRRQNAARGGPSHVPRLGMGRCFMA
jgi:hypothetical protein